MLEYDLDDEDGQPVRAEMKDAEGRCVGYVDFPRTKAQVARELACAVGGYEHVTDAMLDEHGLTRQELAKCAMDYYAERERLEREQRFEKIMLGLSL